MAPWQEMATTVILAVLASSGLWAFLDHRFSRRSAERDVLIGIAHIELLFFGMQYIERGWITDDEYDILKKLYDSYTVLGGNGSGSKIMKEVEKLPLKRGLIDEDAIK